LAKKTKAALLRETSQKANLILKKISLLNLLGEEEIVLLKRKGISHEFH
jgi:hypothetical protein